MSGAHDVGWVGAEAKPVGGPMTRRIPEASMPWLAFPRSLMELAASVGITFAVGTPILVLLL
jgi:hypothetical protein